MESREELFAQADRLEEDGDSGAALHVWRDLVEKYPGPGALLRLGRLCGELGRSDEAEYAYRRALELNPQIGPAYLALGLLALNKGNYEAAEDLLREAVRIDATAAGHCLIGTSLKRQGRTEEARQSYLESIAIDPQFEEAYFNLGVLVGHKDPIEAEALFTKALQLDPDYGGAHRELGFSLVGRDCLEEAEEHLRKAIELDPQDVWAHVYLGNLLWRTGDPAAAAEFSSAAEAAPDWALPLCCLANIHESDEEWPQAQALYEQALALQPDDVVANMNFGRMLAKKGDFERARLYLERALLIDPDNRAARALLSRVVDRSTRTAIRSRTTWHECRRGMQKRPPPRAASPD